MIHSIRIPRSEFDERKAVLLNYVRERHLRGAVIFDSTNILYYSGFAFIPTERPIIYVLSASGEQAMFVPRLELEHVKAETGVDRVSHYREYPGVPRPEVAFKEMLGEMKMLGGEGEIGADMDGYPWILGYEGPRLSELTDLTFVNIHQFIYRQQWIKSAHELALIRESCKWGHLAHVLLQRYTRPGATETAVSLRASNEATLAMMDTIGPIYRAQGWGGGPSAGYRGQIGRNAAIPHALANNIVFQPGDVLVTGAGCLMWGYHSELERTMFIGEPTAEQQALFNHMKNAQEIAFEAMKPGVKCSEVDDAVRAYYEKNKLTAHWKHHSGHAIGLRYHEGPYLDSGDDTVLRPGMVFTVEPGFYSAELGGYRHSDTVAITADGIEQMTYYPRDLEPLIIPV
ncbi:MAG: aminopeptidase P family protein [Anaerolineales bacterium]|nr:aminopeptidase P family protein [Anaerolineales bacterium]